jgi:hypothetical protein
MRKKSPQENTKCSEDKILRITQRSQDGQAIRLVEKAILQEVLESAGPPAFRFFGNRSKTLPQ